MKSIWLIARGEWQYWLRSQIALGGALLFFALIILTTLLSALRMDAELHARSHQQSEAEETFLSQPDRHPHRMVHYGHYLFRTPAPLSLFDPGLDSVTGQSIFLEGHRQNTVMFAESAASADFGGLSWISPALVYQLFAPLVIILLAHGAIVRERESAVLAPLLSMGVDGKTLLAGKALALILFSIVLLVPLLISCTFAVTKGESIAAVLILFCNYFFYLTLWIALSLLVSSLVNKRSMALAGLAGFWFCVTLVLPSVAVNMASMSSPVAGKIESDFAMLEDKRKLGDGHNASDPAFQKLRADILQKYNVEKIEDLPINFRGMVAMEGEKKLTDVLNKHTELRMTAEAKQEKVIANYGWISPAIAIAFVSRSIAGTDLKNYHRFQREAEAVRYEFVQGLNQSHVEKLSYESDINRNKDEESWRRARVDASNWQVLEAYEFQAASLSDRISTAAISMQILFVWLLVIVGFLFWYGGKIKP